MSTRTCWPIGELLPPETLAALRAAFGVTWPRRLSGAWESREEIDRLMRRPPAGRLARILAGEAAGGS